MGSAKRGLIATQATMSAEQKSGVLRLVFSGHLNTNGTAGIWSEAVKAVQVANGSEAVADCAAVEYMDGAGAALMLQLSMTLEERGVSLRVENLREEFVPLLDQILHCDVPGWTKAEECRRRTVAEVVGQAAGKAINSMERTISFVGECIHVIWYCATQPHCIRWKDVLLSTIEVGVNSLAIIILVGFLMGLIMSFQSAVSLERFGAEIFVPNMLGLVMFREMGPLVTSILLAARSGSAFAAEIGTMKVNEEVDALVTMGLSPMRFLVAPKILAAVFAVPLMTLFFNFASLVGGALVMLSLGFPMVTFTSRVFSNLQYMDFAGGMLKALVFSTLVAGVGCLRGLETKTGASAVGLSTTSAVVSGIILIAVADGIFAVVFYYLGI